MSGDGPALSSGYTILHYRLTEKLGEGGMGQVWAARDSTLDRLVAIKALPAALAADPERLARFEREAKLLASLNHPNIATVHSVHVVDGQRYLIMELVPGEDLSQRIARGALPLHDALEIARQIALALAAAHDQGVIHRDLKPANVRLTPDGQVKVLDFGLAKAFEPSPASTATGLSQSPTFLGSMTPGVILGTAGYMAPEQARGQLVDRRADLWGLGVILYEMLSGARAFEGETVSDTLAAVLRAEPDRALLPADLPVPIRLLLDKLLQKDPRKRLRDVGAALLLLEETIDGGTLMAPAGATAGAPAATAPATGARRLLPWIAAAVAVLVALPAGWFLRPAPPESPLRKYSLALDAVEGNVANPALSPDGRWLAFTAQGRLWVRDFRQGTPRRMLEGLDEDFRPAWSPDSRTLVVAAGNNLMRVAVEGGTVTPICSTPGFTGGAGGSWLDDRRIAFTRGSDHLYVVAASGGVPDTLVARRDSVEIDIHHPCVLPGGEAVLVAMHRPGGPPDQLVVLEGDRRKVVLEIPTAGFWTPVYDPRGFILFGRLGNASGVWAIGFDAARRETRGDPFLVAAAASQPSVSADGLLAYQAGVTSLDYPVVRMNRKGEILDTLSAARPSVASLSLSPDETKLVVESRDPNVTGLWLDDLERRSTSRFAFDPKFRFGDACWSPDGRLIAWAEFSAYGIWIRPADGSQPARLLTTGQAPRFTPDGRHLMVRRRAVGNLTDLHIVDIDSPADSTIVLSTPAEEDRPMPAPQGGYYLYLSDESGRRELYLRTWPDTGGRWQVSAEGAELAQWSPQGDRIYYTRTDEIQEVTVDLGPPVKLGTPRLLFRTDALPVVNWGRYDFAPTRDPDIFLFLATDTRMGMQTNLFTVVESWTAEFPEARR